MFVQVFRGSLGRLFRLFLHILLHAFMFFYLPSKIRTPATIIYLNNMCTYAHEFRVHVISP